MGDPRLILGYQTDLSQRDFNASVEGCQALGRGLPVPLNQRPNTIFADRKGKGRKSFPPLFMANGFWIVSQQVAEVMQRFELGDGVLHPIVVLGPDDKTPLDGSWFCWIFGNRKDTLDAEASVNLRAHSPVPGDDWRKLANSPVDDDVALSREALVGPDVWIENRLKQAVLLSGPLGDALAAAKFTKALRMTRVRILE